MAKKKAKKKVNGIQRGLHLQFKTFVMLNAFIMLNTFVMLNTLLALNTLKASGNWNSRFQVAINLENLKAKSTLRET